MLASKEFTIFLYALLAGFLGGLIGLERELANKPAGLRTHILIAISAALLATLPNYFYAETNFPSQLGTDPMRIVQAIILGISFLGAGTILRRDNQSYVEGLTTSASILITAVIGILVSLHLILLAILVTVTILLVNYSFVFLENWLKKRTGERPEK